jgi:hypothetical protein
LIESRGILAERDYNRALPAGRRFGGFMPKFDFTLTTRDGQKVEHIQIYGQDLPDAERKLRQMYHHCQVTQCSIVSHEKELSQSADIEDVLSLIVKNS